MDESAGDDIGIGGGVTPSCGVSFSMYAGLRRSTDTETGLPFNITLNTLCPLCSMTCGPVYAGWKVGLSASSRKNTWLHVARSLKTNVFSLQSRSGFRLKFIHNGMESGGVISNVGGGSGIRMKEFARETQWFAVR